MTGTFSKCPFDDASGKELLAFLAAHGINSAISGTFTANGASTVSVAAPSVTDSSQISISLNTPGGTVGALPAVQTITPGTGFDVAASASDTSVYNYSITN